MNAPLRLIARPITPAIGMLDLVLAVGLIWIVELILSVVLVAAYGLQPLQMNMFFLLVTRLLSGVWTMAVCWYFLCHRPRVDLEIGFAWTWPTWRQLAGYAGFGVLAAILAGTMHERWATGQSLMPQLAATPTGFFSIALLALLMPAVEECYYRGFLFPILRRQWSAPTAIIVTTLWFSLPHLAQVWGDWFAAGIILIMGTVLTGIRHHTQSLTPALIMHWTYNTTLIAWSLGGLWA